MRHYDVVISGGAMAGLTLALAIHQLSGGKKRVAVIEAFEADHNAHPGFDARAIALADGSVELLKMFGLWSSLENSAEPIKHINVSDRGHAGMTDIGPNDANREVLGYVVELATVGNIYHQLLEQTNIDWFCPDSAQSIAVDSDHCQIKLNSGEQLKTKLIVAADGAFSSVCQQLGLVLNEHDFKQHAVIANVELNQAHNGRAFERFTSSGPLALLPMSDNRMSLVWCVKPEQVDQVLSWSDDEFLDHLQQEFGWRLGRFKKVGTRSEYPLLLRHRVDAVSHRLAIVGNASQTLHPIAGQGFNLGIRDIATLAELVATSDDPGAYSVLAQFQERREPDRKRTMALTSTLVHTFSNDHLAMRMGRNLGLMLMDNLPFSKQPLVNRTLGRVNR